MANPGDCIRRQSAAFTAIALMLLAGCHLGGRQTADTLDPIPPWYNDEYRDSMYSFFTYGWGNMSELGSPGSSIIDMRLLAWQAVSDIRPLIDTNHIQYQSMLWVHLRSQIMKRDGWALVRVIGRPGGWELTRSSMIRAGILIYDHPPRSREIYAANLWVYFFDSNDDWTIHDGYLRANTWEAVTGEKPTRQFVVRRE